LADATSADERSAPFGPGQVSLLWQRYRRHRGGVVALVVLGLLVLAIALIPAVTGFTPLEASPLASLAPAGSTDAMSGKVHLLGADYLGRDVLTRLFYAGRASLLVALIATAVTVTLGVIVGAIAGYYGGWIDTALMSFTDFMLALPLLPMYIFGFRMLVTTFDPQQFLVDTMGGVTSTFAIFTIFGWMGVARLVRSSILSLRTLDYVEASRALGAGSRRIIFRHLLPNALAPVFVAAAFTVGDFIVWESILAYFLQGIVDPPTPSWGNMLVGSIQYVGRLASLNPFADIRAFLFLLPTLMIFVSVLCFNYIGDTLREILDPRRAVAVR
jgi:peptide/nickel transport system permease protein